MAIFDELRNFFVDGVVLFLVVEDWGILGRCVAVIFGDSIAVRLLASLQIVF